MDSRLDFVALKSLPDGRSKAVRSVAKEPTNDRIDVAETCNLTVLRKRRDELSANFIDIGRAAGPSALRVTTL